MAGKTRLGSETTCVRRERVYRPRDGSVTPKCELCEQRRLSVGPFQVGESRRRRNCRESRFRLCLPCAKLFGGRPYFGRPRRVSDDVTAGYALIGATVGRLPGRDPLPKERLFAETGAWRVPRWSAPNPRLFRNRDGSIECLDVFVARNAPISFTEPRGKGNPPDRHHLYQLPARPSGLLSNSEPGQCHYCSRFCRVRWFRGPSVGRSAAIYSVPDPESGGTKPRAKIDAVALARDPYFSLSPDARALVRMWPMCRECLDLDRNERAQFRQQRAVKKLLQGEELPLTAGAFGFSVDYLRQIASKERRTRLARFKEAAELNILVMYSVELMTVEEIAKQFDGRYSERSVRDILKKWREVLDPNDSLYPRRFRRPKAA
jgi:hypothetical protein